MTLLMQDFSFVKISITCFFGIYCAEVFVKFNAFHKVLWEGVHYMINKYYEVTMAEVPAMTAGKLCGLVHLCKPMPYLDQYRK
jgi:hypothetical protein